MASKYLYSYLELPILEYVVKLGLERIAAYLAFENAHSSHINEKGRNIREALGVEPRDLPMLKKINAGMKQLALYQVLKTANVKFDESLLVWYERNKINNTGHIWRPLRLMTQSKLVRYAESQYGQLKNFPGQYGTCRYENIGRVLSEYNDYLEFAKELRYDTANDFVLFPKHLEEAHDLASAQIKARRDEAICKAGDRFIKKAYKKLTRTYQFSGRGFTVIPPKTASDIVNEGHTLRHCVHSYVEKVAKGKCVILFLRKIDSLTEPFYTIELKENRVTQARGLHNGAPTPEVKKFLNEWDKKLLAPLRSQTHNAQAAA
jgi:hypothetical protein